MPLRIKIDEEEENRQLLSRSYPSFRTMVCRKGIRTFLSDPALFLRWRLRFMSGRSVGSVCGLVRVVMSFASAASSRLPRCCVSVKHRVVASAASSRLPCARHKLTIKEDIPWEASFFSKMGMQEPFLYVEDARVLAELQPAVGSGSWR